MVGERKVAYTTKELGPDTWPDFERLFEKHNGVQGGCWCMYYQRPRPIRTKVPRTERTAMNKKDKRSLVHEGQSHGTIVYKGRTPVGWCQYGPREELPRIDAGRNYRKVGPLPPEKKLWRITCFFVDRRYRRMEVSKAALHSALVAIRKNGGKAVEGYPVQPPEKKFSSSMMWNGTVKLFQEFRFSKVAPLGKRQWIVRKKL